MATQRTRRKTPAGAWDVGTVFTEPTPDDAPDGFVPRTGIVVAVVPDEDTDFDEPVYRVHWFTDTDTVAHSTVVDGDQADDQADAGD